MAKSQWQINMNFKNAKKWADDLDAAAVALGRVARIDINNNIMNSMHSVWRGDSADKYRDKMQAMKDRTEHMAEYLAKYALAIRDRARIVYNAEMTALRIAQSNSGGGGFSGGGGGGGGGRGF